MNDSDLIQLLKKDDKLILKKIYVDYRSDFIAFGRKISLYEDDILDAYQDAIITLQEQVITGKLNTLNCSIKTYLFGIGKYILYEKNRKRNKTILSAIDTNEITMIEVPIFSEILTSQQKKIKLGFKQLGKKCIEVIELFYYRGYTLEEITETLNYENKNVVKSQKSRCLKKLKEIIKSLK